MLNATSARRATVQVRTHTYPARLAPNPPFCVPFVSLSESFRTQNSLAAEVGDERLAAGAGEQAKDRDVVRVGRNAAARAA